MHQMETLMFNFAHGPFTNKKPQTNRKLGLQMREQGFTDVSRQGKFKGILVKFVFRFIIIIKIHL